MNIDELRKKLRLASNVADAKRNAPLEPKLELDAPSYEMYSQAEWRDDFFNWLDAWTLGDTPFQQGVTRAEQVYELKQAFLRPAAARHDWFSDLDFFKELKRRWQGSILTGSEAHKLVQLAIGRRAWKYRVVYDELAPPMNPRAKAFENDLGFEFNYED